MTDRTQEAHASGPYHRTLEIAVAGIIAGFGLLVMFGSLKVGIGWGPEGPKSGFFPFYVGAIVVISAGVSLAQVLLAEHDRALFAEWSQLRQVLAVVIPTTVYVLAVPYLGLYVTSLLLIAGFMKRLGRYGWPATIAVSVGVVLATYLMFEKWFLVPLPKGPVEELVGL